MLRFRKSFLILLLLTIAASPCHLNAATNRTYDLDSLCFMSTDVVVATLSWHHVAGQKLWQDTMTAKVDNCIAGQYHAGDEIASLYFGSYSPAMSTQRCILFLARKEFAFQLQPSETISPRLTDMLLIDSQNHVRRYFQLNNPGGLLAQGYFRSMGLSGAVVEYYTKEDTYPTLAAERKIITSKWAAVDKLRPILSHDPRPEDIPVLLNILRERQTLHQSSSWGQRLKDGLAETICSRIADLNDPSVALDAISMASDAAWDSGLDTIPFSTAAGMEYARSVSLNTHESATRRAAAAEVIRFSSR